MNGANECGKGLSAGCAGGGPGAPALQHSSTPALRYSSQLNHGFQLFEPSKSQSLVLGVVRLGLDANYDRLEDMANHHTLLRQMLGLPQNSWGNPAKVFHHQTLRDNVCLVDAPLLKQINGLVAAAGRAVFHSGSGPLAPLAIKVDTYVLETDVHFPTDLNLLLDAGRKCLDLIKKYRDQYGYELPGWRKLDDWRARFKATERVAARRPLAEARTWKSACGLPSATMWRWAGNWRAKSLLVS